MRVPRTLLLAAVVVAAASCTSAPSPIDPAERAAASAGISTIGSGGRDAGTTGAASDTTAENSTPRGISTIGSGG